MDYMSRPDEIERVEECPDFRSACTLARRMSDQHNGTAAVIAIDYRSERSDDCSVAGHVEFFCGMVSEKVGALEGVDIPR